MGKLACLCCGCLTLDERGGHGGHDICPVCFWEDDIYPIFGNGEIKGVLVDKEVSCEDLLDVPSWANHGLTLREGRENYRNFGACEKSMKKYVRKPKKSELPKQKSE